MSSGNSNSKPDTESQFLPQKPSVAILGVGFDPVNMDETLALIDGMIQARTPRYLATANLDFAVQASRDVELRRILFDAHLVLCDGMPLVWLSKLLGATLPERVTGSDMTPILIQRAAEKGYRIFLLGGAEESLKHAVEKTRSKYPNLALDAYSPPFKPLLDMDHEDINRRIQDFKPDILFVAFGCPKQEKWINMHFRKGLAPVSVGVGATIDFIAGQVQRAPVWMQKTGTEWIYRLLQEPKRLFKRYMIGLGMFAWKSIWEVSENRIPRKYRRFIQDPAVFGEEKSETQASIKIIRLAKTLTSAQIQNQQSDWTQMLKWTGSIIIDCTETRFMDSLGIGLIIRLRKQSIATGQSMLLVVMSQELRDIFKRSGMDLFVENADSIELAKARLVDRSGAKAVVQNEPSEASISWKHEVTAANVDEVWDQTFAALQAFEALNSSIPFRIDLRELNFIDSSGVGLMVKIKKHAATKEIHLEYQNPPAPVINVLELTKMKNFLIHS